MPICKYCDKEVKRQFKRHVRICKYKRCTLCNKNFRGLQEFAVHHLLSHEGESNSSTYKWYVPE